MATLSTGQFLVLLFPNRVHYTLYYFGVQSVVKGAMLICDTFRDPIRDVLIYADS